MTSILSESIASSKGRAMGYEAKTELVKYFKNPYAVNNFPILQKNKV